MVTPVHQNGFSTPELRVTPRARGSGAGRLSGCRASSERPRGRRPPGQSLSEHRDTATPRGAGWQGPQRPHPRSAAAAEFPRADRSPAVARSAPKGATGAPCCFTRAVPAARPFPSAAATEPRRKCPCPSLRRVGAHPLPLSFSPRLLTPSAAHVLVT